MVDQPLLLIATTNQGKLREVQGVLADLPIKLTSLRDYGVLPKPIENADTFEGNACIKALHYAQHAGCWSLADDSGLEVDVLGGRPGVFSARWAWEGCTPADNNTRLCAELGQVPADKRTARYRCVLALADPSGILATAAGTLEGLIVTEPRGSNGFGYDPHFLVPHLGLTVAEMPPERKNALSHRGQALIRIRPELTRLMGMSAQPQSPPDAL